MTNTNPSTTTIDQFISSLSESLSSLMKGDVETALFPPVVKDFVSSITNDYVLKPWRSLLSTSSTHSSVKLQNNHIGDTGSLDDILSDWKGFINAIDWTEPFILGLLSFHVVTLLWIYFVRKSEFWLGYSMFALVGLALIAEPLNNWSKANHKLFTKIDYFDSHGVFAAAMFSGPIAFNLCVLMYLLLKRAFNVMVTAKRMQLKTSASKKSS